MPAFLVQYPSRVGLTLPEGANSFVVFASNAANAKSMVAGHFSGDQNALILSADMIANEVVVAGEDDMSGYSLLINQIGAAAGDYSQLVNPADTHFAIGSVAIDDGGSATYVVDEILDAAGGTLTATGREATFRVTSVNTGVIDGIELVDPGDYLVLPTLLANPVVGGGGSLATMDLTAAAKGSWFDLAGRAVTLLNEQTDIAGALVDFSEGGAGTRLFTCSDITDAFGDGTLTFELRKNGSALAQLVSTLVDGGIAGAVLTAAIPAIPFAAAQVTALKS